MKFSVCIPTFNRPKGLIRAIDSFQNQTYNKPFEIIVCDNASDPEIEKLVHKYNQTAKIKVKYFGQEGGIHQVRSRLVYEARGDLILMIDDDESACSELLDIYNKLFEDHKDLAAAGGPCIINWEDTPPEWVLNYIEDRRVSTLWGRYEPHDEFKIGVGVGIWGGDMVLRRQLFVYTGFRPDVFKGRNMGDGESGLMIDIANRKLKTAYVPEAYVLHYMNKSRFNLDYVRTTASYMGIPFAYWRWHQARKSIYKYITEIFRIFKIYYKVWIKYVYFHFFTSEITNSKINVEFHANVGLFQIKYIYWLITDRYFRVNCDWDDFRPKSCIKLYNDFYKNRKQNLRGR